MPLFNKQSLLRKFDEGASHINESYRYAYAEVFLDARAKEFKHSTTYDIFLSHSYDDSRVIKALRDELTELNFSVYVDWIDDSKLERESVTKYNALIIRNRMKNCKCLFYATSESAEKSVWMPWELGYMDSYTNRVAILPILEKPSFTDAYDGREYLGIYPFVEKTGDILYIHDAEKKWVKFDDWIIGNNPINR